MLLHPSTQGSRPPARKGRAAGSNPANRFETLRLVPDPMEPDDEDFKDRVPTEFFVDSSKSVLAENDSPDVGFRFSLNPYRGCEHGCIYCACGDTPILLGDGSTRPLADLQHGDEIYGTRRRGHYRRYQKTVVLAHWEVNKPAHRITLQDGTQLVASGDHRYLTPSGWKFVTGDQQGVHRRPHLTLNDKLLGTGAFAAGADAPTSQKLTEDYRRGYLCGLIRGDGLRASYSYSGRRGNTEEYHRFHLALAADEPLTRASAYLNGFGVATHTFLFQKAASQRRPMHGIRTQLRRGVDAVHDLVAWPSEPSSDWSRGYLSGIFDVEGSYSDGVLRISNTSKAILEQTTRALGRLGHSCVTETQASSRDEPVQSVRVRGGLRAHLRLFHQVEPASTRKRSIEGQVLNSLVPLRVESIEPVGSMTLFDITTGTGDFIAAGVVSHNCYARPSHEYLGFSAGLDFETKVLVKPDAPELLEATFRKKSWQPQPVALSGSTDCYQPVERRLELTRRCLQVFLEFRNPVTLTTKNHLVTRDLDILGELAALDLVHVTLSITSLKPKLTAVMEPRTSRPRLRLRAIEQLAGAGVPTGVNLAPLIPGLNDDEMPAVLGAAAARGARWARYMMLRLPGAVEPLFLDWLERHFPDRVARVASRVRAVRDGKLSDSRFGSRLRGEGELARALASFFDLARRRHGLEGGQHELATHHFRRHGHDQLGLFDGLA